MTLLSHQTYTHQVKGIISLIFVSTHLHADWAVVVRSVLDTFVSLVPRQTQATCEAVGEVVTTSNPDMRERSVIGERFRCHLVHSVLKL